MLKSALVMTAIIYSMSITAQKQVISTDSFNKWPTLSFKCISPDGEYVAYVIRNNVANIDSLIIQSTNNEWRIYAINPGNSFFSNDSKRIFYTTGDNQVVAQSLGKENREIIDCIDIIKNPY